MYAIVEIAGQQYKAEPKDVLITPLLDGEPGDEIVFDKILLIQNGDKTQVGDPYIEGKAVAKILENGRDKKVLIFHKKRRKGYRKLNGHRQHYTKIEITNIDI